MKAISKLPRYYQNEVGLPPIKIIDFIQKEVK
jgi:hypothetical protein